MHIMRNLLDFCACYLQNFTFPTEDFQFGLFLKDTMDSRKNTAEIFPVLRPVSHQTVCKVIVKECWRRTLAKPNF